MTLTPADIKLIVSTLQDSEWDQAEVVVGDVRVAVARNGARLDQTAASAASSTKEDPTAVSAAAPASATAAPETSFTSAEPTPAPPPSDDTGLVITAPTVGVLWRAPQPGAEPFVDVGTKVAVGDTVGIVEVMKLMSNVTTDVAGTVTAVHAENSQNVEFGTALVTIRPED